MASGRRRAAARLFVSYLVAQQAVVHKHAVQPLTQHPVNQGGSHGAVHTTRQGADSMFCGANLQHIDAKGISVSAR